MTDRKIGITFEEGAEVGTGVDAAFGYAESNFSTTSIERECRAKAMCRGNSSLKKRERGGRVGREKGGERKEERMKRKYISKINTPIRVREGVGIKFNN